jgi:predicted ATPase
MQTYGSYLHVVWHTFVKAVQNDLADFRYLGPLREIPTSSYVPSEEEDPRRWAKGLAAWDAIRYNSGGIIDTTNEWFSEFKIGYQIILKEYKTLDINSMFYKELIAPDNKSHQINIQHEFDNMPIARKIVLRDTHSGIELEPTDVGVGISQVFPLIPLALGGDWVENRHGIIAIEQPELHIHPAMQATLGDLFIEGIGHENNCFSSKRFIIETHSEHLLLRLLRRIREGDGWPASEDIVIQYLEPSKEGIKVTYIRVDKEGEFIGNWPHGFFNERAEELF